MNLLNGECKSGVWRLAKRQRQKQTKHEEMCFVIEQSVACRSTARSAK
jgi:hypothetical protein